MTVTDLIDYLNTLPKETVIGVSYSLFSNVEILQEDDLRFHPVGEKSNYPKMVLRDGRLMWYDKLTWPKEEVPQFVPVLEFPGN